MAAAYELWLLCALAAYLGAWWLAVWIIAGNRFGPLVFIPVAIFAFGALSLLAGFVTPLGPLPKWAPGLWIAAPFVIDGCWGARQLVRRSRRG
jgi:hypothetical protein